LGDTSKLGDWHCCSLSVGGSGARSNDETKHVVLHV